MFLRSAVVNGKKYYQIAETKDKKQVWIRHLGSAEKINRVFAYAEDNGFIKGVSKKPKGHEVSKMIDDQIHSKDEQWRP